MSPNLKSAVIAAVTALVITLGIALLLNSGKSSSPAAGNTTQTNLFTYAPKNTTAFVGPYGVESDAGFFDAVGAVSDFLGEIVQGNSTTLAGLTQYETITSCAGISSTSTLADISNPLGATSTATVSLVTATGNATSTTFNMGTTTASQGLSSSNTTSVILNSAVVATNTIAFFAPGAAQGNGTYAGASVSKTVVVGKSENIGLYGTSSESAAGSSGYSPNLSSCVIKIKWED